MRQSRTRGSRSKNFAEKRGHAASRLLRRRQRIRHRATKRKATIPGYAGVLPTKQYQTIIFYDLSRLARSVEKGLLELKRLADEGYNFYFASMDFLNYDIDPMLKKRIIMDFYGLQSYTSRT